jgi:hypothetical protein
MCVDDRPCLHAGLERKRSQGRVSRVCFFAQRKLTVHVTRWAPSLAAASGNGSRGEWAGRASPHQSCGVSSARSLARLWFGHREAPSKSVGVEPCPRGCLRPLCVLTHVGRMGWHGDPLWGGHTALPRYAL